MDPKPRVQKSVSMCFNEGFAVSRASLYRQRSREQTAGLWASSLIVSPVGNGQGSQRLSLKALFGGYYTSAAIFRGIDA